MRGRKVLLGVSGGIAAYKSVYLARRLVEADADVRVVMTGAAQRFVGPVSLAAVTGNPVSDQLFGEESISPHTELAAWADLIVVAPATTHTIGKLAAGLSDDLLSATIMAAVCPVFLAPAMHTEMWENAATQRNIATLLADGVHVVGPGSGALAGGDEGEGRMIEPEEIVEAIEAVFSGPLRGWKVMVTAGGTREPIDPVRYIGNRSSGRMGTEIAAAASRAGADVTLVTSSQLIPSDLVEIVEVETTEEMAVAVWDRASAMDVVVMAAAVADFRPKELHTSKLRRQEGPPDLILEPTTDILAGVVHKAPKAFLVGFAAETGPAEAALHKARLKGVDLLVANDVTAPGSGFGSETNEVTVIDPEGNIDSWPLLTKRQVANRLWDRVAELRS